ncbi:MAG TPA: aldose 1-epimerase, partial [Dongiaceae bacterium]|nr:aldose 1-epimerase [Dongiaceae bacterium]
MELLSLHSDQLHLEVAPAAGGSVARLDWRSQPILRRADAAAVARGGASRAAMHPLVPFANRVPGNVIDLVAPPLSLQPNVAGEACALHGIGWQRPWRVLDWSDDRCRLELIVGEGEWAFGFRATQAFRLRAARFEARIEIENTTKRPIPAGIGFHPYFVRAGGMMLQFRARHFWMEGPGHLPTEAISLPPELDFSGGGMLPVQWRNNGYSGWDGEAVLFDPGRHLRVDLSATEPLRELMLYVPPASAYFCLEP